MRWVPLILLVLAAAAVLAWEFVPVVVTIGDGYYELKVHMASNAGELESVRCKPCSHVDEAEFILGHPTHPESISRMPSHPADGKPISVVIPISTRTSPMGREIARHQNDRLLVVHGRFRDGREVSKVVPIPDSREAQEVSVVLP